MVAPHEVGEGEEGEEHRGDGGKLGGEDGKGTAAKWPFDEEVGQGGRREADQQNGDRVSRTGDSLHVVEAPKYDDGPVPEIE